MVGIKIPEIGFPKWKKWTQRERPSQNLDVPAGFGLCGIYMLATGAVDSELGAETERHLDEAVIYIGMSAHIEQRLERPHEAVSKYKRLYGDRSASNLRFTIWHSGAVKWPNERKSSTVEAARIAVYERVLLLMYAEKFGRLPQFNQM